MDEATFWGELEHRVSREFDGMRGECNHLRSFGCDGLVPHQYHLEDADSRITGLAWIVRNDDQQEWEFTLFLPRRYASREEIEWEKLLPTVNVTKWIALDIEARQIQFEPMAAIPDGP